MLYSAKYRLTLPIEHFQSERVTKAQVIGFGHAARELFAGPQFCNAPAASLARGIGERTGTYYRAGAKVPGLCGMRNQVGVGKGRVFARLELPDPLSSDVAYVAPG